MMEKRLIVIPTNCPSCNSILDEINGQLFCRNNKCEAKNLKTLIHFCEVLKIKGLGPKTLLKLDLENIKDIYETNIDHYIEVLGEKIGTKVYREIRDSIKADLQLVLQAFGINRIGESTSKKISKIVNHISEISESTCKKAGLGQVDTSLLLEWIKNNTELIQSLPFEYKSNNTQLATNILGHICITGALKNFTNRNVAKIYLESNGYIVKDSITSKTTALICEENKESSKTLQAKAKNIPILTIEELIKKDINDNKI